MPRNSRIWFVHDRHDPHSTPRKPSEAVSPEEALDDLERLIEALG